MNIDKKILKFAFPNIISNITVPLLGLVDMALMGHLPNEKYIGAIALGSVIFNMIYWNFGFLRMSTSGLTAQAFGTQDTKKSAALLAQSVSIALLGGLAIFALQYPIEKLGFYLLGGSEHVKELAVSYYRIRLWAAPATISIYAFSGWFLGMHDAKSPMIVAITINILNILFNLLFVVVFKMTSDGVAFGTLLAQYGGLIFYVYLTLKKHPSILKEISRSTITNLKAYRSFISVSGDIFFRTLCIITAFTFFTSKSAEQGDVLLGVNALFKEYIMLFALIMDGFAYAAEPITGSYYANKQYKELRIAIKRLFVWGAGVMIFCTLLFFVGGEALLKLLTNQEGIIEAAQPYLMYATLIPITGFAAFMWDGIYIGMTRSRQMLRSVAASFFLLFLPIYYIFEPAYSNHALWWAMLSLFAGRGIIQTLFAKRWIYSRI